jgi:hypothetical protein
VTATLILKLETHAAVTVVFAVIVPVALLLNVHVCPEGCVCTETEYDEPVAYALVKVCVLFVVKVSASALLSCRTSVAPLANPLTEALMLNVTLLHVIATVTLAFAVPLALGPREHVSPVGCVTMLTAYVCPTV